MFMGFWKKLFGLEEEPEETTYIDDSDSEETGDDDSEVVKDDAYWQKELEELEKMEEEEREWELDLYGYLPYEGGPVEEYYEQMSRSLIDRHGPLVGVDFTSHYPTFEIYFLYEDGERLYSGQREGRYDLNFMSLGYVGEGPRYAGHFLAAAGFDLSSDEIASIKPGDSIEMRDGSAVIIRQDEKVKADPSVTFREKREEETMGAMATYMHYDAPDMATARAFLDAQDITWQSYFVVVDTPEGAIAKDRMGVFEP